MNSRQFDIAILGNTLSARIAAALLAKNGQKVILFAEPAAPEPNWFFSSIFLEKLLGSLGGRACFTSPRPFQVISPSSRVTVHGAATLEEELAREFGRVSVDLLAMLDSLRELGGRLNELLWENKGLPWPGLKDSVRFRSLCLRRNISRAGLDLPLQTKLDAFAPQPREFLTNLFQGLSLLPIEVLSVAEGAQIWTHACRQENLAEPDFSTLLEKRLLQFHGVVESPEKLEKLDFRGTTFTGGQIRDRGAFQARWLLIGDDLTGRGLLPETLRAGPERPAVSNVETTGLDRQISPLLEKQVIVGGEHPMRLSLDENGAGKVSAYGVVSEQSFRRQLEPALPFASYGLKPRTGSVSRPPGERGRQSAGLFSLSLILGGNVLSADSSALVPALGPPGAGLLGWTLANRLGTVGKEKK